MSWILCRWYNSFHHSFIDPCKEGNRECMLSLKVCSSHCKVWTLWKYMSSNENVETRLESHNSAGCNTDSPASILTTQHRKNTIIHILTDSCLCSLPLSLSHTHQGCLQPHSPTYTHWCHSPSPHTVTLLSSFDWSFTAIPCNMTSRGTSGQDEQ